MNYFLLYNSGTFVVDTLPKKITLADFDKKLTSVTGYALAKKTSVNLILKISRVLCIFMDFSDKDLKPKNEIHCFGSHKRQKNLIQGNTQCTDSTEKQTKSERFR